MDQLEYPTNIETDGNTGAEGTATMDSLNLLPAQSACTNPAEEASTNLTTHLQELLDEYAASYNDEAMSNAARMTRAKAFAIALLQNHYPETEGYTVRSSSLGPMANRGINFYLKAQTGKDPTFTSLLPKKDNKKGKKKQSKARLDRQKIADERRLFSQLSSLTWHSIDPENIAGFEILQKTPGDTDYLPLTYLAIIIDNLTTLPLIATNNDVHRGDILTDALCRSQHIRSGYGILLYGTRLEVYEFENGEETEFIEGEDGEVTVTADEPVTTLAKNANSEDIVLDLKTANVQQVDQMFNELAARKVEFLVAKIDSGENEGQDLMEGDGMEVAPEVVIAETQTEHMFVPQSNVRNEGDDFI